MKQAVFLTAAAMFGCVLAGAAADAALVVDRGPNGAPLFDAALINVTSGKNYLVQFSFAQRTELTGMEIWAGYGGTIDPPGSVTIEIKVRADHANQPAATNLY